jgi:hypothetical protein
MYLVLTALMHLGHYPDDSHDFTFGDFIGKNLVPATIGNIIGGALCMGSVYYYLYHEHTTVAIQTMKLNQGKHRTQGLPMVCPCAISGCC